MKLTEATLSKIAGGSPTADRTANIRSILAGLDAYGEKAGLDRPHRLAHYVPQIAHESARFRYDREIWGPTAAQKRYEGRADLGNTQPGDGSKFRGYGPIQLTGRHNVTAFYKWCVSVGGHPPDFVADPKLITTDPWEGLSAIWYWTVGNPTGQSLNVLADANNIEMVTRRINGGLNGFSDRCELYTRTALVFLGYDLKAGVIKAFQKDAGIKADDIDGPATRAALHSALTKLETVTPPAPPTVEPGPVSDPDAADLLTIQQATNRMLARRKAA